MDWRRIMGNEHFESYPQKEQKEQKGSEEGSFATTATIALKDQKVKNMSEEDLYCFEERAAIMEFDGGLPRGEAETLAMDAIRGGAGRISRDLSSKTDVAVTHPHPHN